MVKMLKFEEPIANLKKKIEELKELAHSADIDMTAEIQKLESRLQELQKDIYDNMTPWDRVQVARHLERPTTLDYVKGLFDDFMELHGDRNFGDDLAMVGGVASFSGIPVTIIGHQRGTTTKENIRRNFGMPHPEGYRKALRLMKQAEKFNRPIICFIDTKGAYPGKAAEERGQSEAIARNLVEMAGLTVPVISIVIGEGGSGGAIGLGVANRVYMLENSTYSVISPEGAASILWKDASLASEAASAMRITARDLYELDVINGVIEEALGGAHHHLKQQIENIRVVLQQALSELMPLTKEQLVQDRYNRFRKMGEYEELTATQTAEPIAENQ